MVSPIICGESYVGNTGRSTKIWVYTTRGQNATPGDLDGTGTVRGSENRPFTFNYEEVAFILSAAAHDSTPR